jgi:ribosomal protein S26
MIICLKISLSIREAYIHIINFCFNYKINYIIIRIRKEEEKEKSLSFGTDRLRRNVAKELSLKAA